MTGASTHKQSDFVFHINRSPILSTALRFAWKRELSCFQGQNLPEALFGANFVAIHHSPSDVRISFTALESLRSWASLDVKPVRVKGAWEFGGPQHSATGPTRALDFDYTFTNRYAGSVDLASSVDAELPRGPDMSSIVCRKGVDVAVGDARLRKPLCKCKGEGGRVPFCGEGSKREANVFVKPSLIAQELSGTAPPVAPPQWRRTNEVVDAEAMLRSHKGPPVFWDIVPLFEDDLHENGMSLMKVSVFVGEDFWFVNLRFYLRVTKVMARLIDTRFTCRTDIQPIKVHRERMWKEGTWEDLVGSSAINEVVSLDQLNDRIAARRLPDKLEPERHVMTFPESKSSAKLPKLEEMLLFSRTNFFCEALCDAKRDFVAVTGGGTKVELINGSTGETIWTKEISTSIAGILSVSASPRDPLIALGTEEGSILLWNYTNSEQEGCFTVLPPAPTQRRQNTNRWVEKICWSKNGMFVGGAAGQRAVLAKKIGWGGHVAEIVTEGNSVSAIEMCGDGIMAVGSYGTVQWAGAEGKPDLKRGAAAVLALSVSGDGEVAVGFLDKTLRVYGLGRSKDKDWCGFDSGVNLVEYSEGGEYLAAAGGAALLIVPRGLEPGEPPIICRTPGMAEQDGIGNLGRFTALSWGGSVVVAFEGRAGRVHIFDPLVVSDGFPRRAVNICSVEVSGVGLGQVFCCADSGDGQVLVGVGRGKVLSVLKWEP